MRTHAALDPPAETKRQFTTLVVWVAFLLLAVVVGASNGTRMPGDPGAIDVYDGATRSELHRSRLARLKVAVGLGLLAPAICSFLLSRRYRRHGAHARGITVELTETELRVWGRGYGTRVALRGAEVRERLVDVYAGRLGTWRQIRLRLRSRAHEIELAAPASDADAQRKLRLEGGEADCVELDRCDYDALKTEVERRAGA